MKQETKVWDDQHSTKIRHVTKFSAEVNVKNQAPNNFHLPTERKQKGKKTYWYRVGDMGRRDKECFQFFFTNIYATERMKQKDKK